MLIGSVLISASLLLLGAELAGIRMFGIAVSSLALLSLLALLMGIGTGIATPASNVACLDLKPERASTVTGVRGMFRQGGGAIGVAVVTLVLQYAGNIPRGFNIIYTTTGIAVLLTIPFIFGMPARARAMAAAKQA
jgi:MFS family permease